MTVSDALSAGFARAHRRIGSILLDIAWKGIWLAVTGGLLLLFLVWLYGEGQTIEINGAANAIRTPVGLLVLARELWSAYASTVFWVLIGLAGLSLLAWVLLEAYFRAGILGASQPSFRSRASHGFRLFFVSSVTRMLTMAAVTAALGSLMAARYFAAPLSEWRDLWLDSRAVFATAILIGLTVWFFVTLLDTLIRGEALELTGQGLFLVLGLLATLIAFEGMAVAGIAMVGVLLALTLPAATGLLVVLAALPAAVLLLSSVHSYLLVVRFSGLAEMREFFALEGTCPAMGNSV